MSKARISMITLEKVNRKTVLGLQVAEAQELTVARAEKMTAFDLVKPVTPDEDKRKILARLAELERQMDGDAGQIRPAVLSLGRCLYEIQQRSLHRYGLKTFKEYCEQKRGLSERRAYQLIEFANMVDSMPEHLRGLLENESQARQLALCPVEMRVEILAEASKSASEDHGKLTGQRIADTRRLLSQAEGSYEPKPRMNDDWLAIQWDKAPDEQQVMVAEILIKNGFIERVMALIKKRKHNYLQRSIEV